MVGQHQPERPIDPGVRIGHVHLKVADLDRALGFYWGVLGFELMQRHRQLGCWLACGVGPRRVAGRDDDARLPQLCRLSLPGLTTALPGRDDRAVFCHVVHPMRQTGLDGAQAAIWAKFTAAVRFLPLSLDAVAALVAVERLPGGAPRSFRPQLLWATTWKTERRMAEPWLTTPA